MKTLMVTGSRGWKNREAVQRTLNQQKLSGYDHLIVGDAWGADWLAREEALKLGMDVTVYCANWIGHGRAAGPRRNLRMLDQNPDCVVAFWDGESRGTAHAVGVARGRNMQVYVIQEAHKAKSQ